MSREPVFYSFHFDNDVFRVQQIRNMGVIEGDEPVSPNDWEQVKRRGDASIEKWIDDKMSYKRCVVVLAGTETAKRRWVQYEIKKAWESGKGLVGIYIHNLKCARTRTTCAPGSNPFGAFTVQGRGSLSTLVDCHEPNSWDAYGDIAANLQQWVANAITQAKRR